MAKTMPEGYREHIFQMSTRNSKVTRVRLGTYRKFLGAGML
jgi:hypothetical protein